METISRKDLDLAWLAGMIDADGCISFAKQQNSRNKGKTHHLKPYVTVTTTCTLTKDYMIDMYDKYQIPIHVAVKPSKSPDRKEVYTIATIGMKRSKTILSLVKDYLVTKQREANLVLEFIEIRERLFAQKLHEPREDEIVEEMKNIKSNRNYTRNPQRLYARLR